MEMPVLSAIIALPFVGALLIMLQPRNAFLRIRFIAAIVTGLDLALSIYLLLNYDRTVGGFQFVEQYSIVPSLGISLHLGIDGMSLILVVLTAFIIFTGVFASWTIKERYQEFYVLLLLLVTGVFGVFESLDLFIFFLFYELAVLPMYLLIGIFGSSKPIEPKGIFKRAIREMGLGSKEYAAMKLTLYLLFGSAFILVGFLAIYFFSGLSTFDYVELYGHKFGIGFQKLFFFLLYIGFGVLAGVWPLHTWSPDGHASAPTAASMLHAGVLMKLGAYGIVRVAMGLFPQAAHFWAPLMGTIATINIVYGAFSAMWQTDLKYVVAYSSVSHMGVVMLGAATLNEAGLNGSVFQMFSHGIMTGLLFALVGLVYEKAHTRDILKMGGFGKKMPGIALFFTIGGLTSLGLPGLSGFVAEFLVFLGAWKSKFQIWLFPAVIGAFITAVYVLRVLKIIFWGPFKEEDYPHLPDAEGPEWVALVVLSGVLIVFGILPMIGLLPIDTSVTSLLGKIGGALR